MCHGVKPWAGKELDTVKKAEDRLWQEHSWCLSGKGWERKAEVRSLGSCSCIMELIVFSYLWKLLNHYILNENEPGGRI